MSLVPPGPLQPGADVPTAQCVPGLVLQLPGDAPERHRPALQPGIPPQQLLENACTPGREHIDHRCPARCRMKLLQPLRRFHHDMRIACIGQADAQAAQRGIHVLQIERWIAHQRQQRTQFPDVLAYGMDRGMRIGEQRKLLECLLALTLRALADDRPCTDGWHGVVHRMGRPECTRRSRTDQRRVLGGCGCAASPYHHRRNGRRTEPPLPDNLYSDRHRPAHLRQSGYGTHEAWAASRVSGNSSE